MSNYVKAINVKIGQEFYEPLTDRIAHRVLCPPNQTETVVQNNLELIAYISDSSYSWLDASTKVYI